MFVGVGTADALPLVTGADTATVTVVDGGIIRGTDVVKALLLGADLVAVGRPVLYALAAAGEAGATMALGMLKEEILCAMALVGVNCCHSEVDEHDVCANKETEAKMKFLGRRNPSKL